MSHHKLSDRGGHRKPCTAEACLREAELYRTLAAELPDEAEREIVACFKRAAYWQSKAAHHAAREARQGHAAAPSDAAMPPACVEGVQVTPEAAVTAMEGMNAIVSRRLRRGK
jgi:hypothetical protein